MRVYREGAINSTAIRWLLFIFLNIFWVVCLAQTEQPQAVTVAGSFQEELGCGGDWMPECDLTVMELESDDQVWQQTLPVPAGQWEYKAPINRSWSENYGLGAVFNGANIPLDVASDTEVKFYYSHETHWITDNQNSLIATVPGNFQAALGCANDWDPACLHSWLQDPDGDGLYRFVTSLLPAGTYEAKVALNENWIINYGVGGVLDGENIVFTVPQDCIAMEFLWDSLSNELFVQAIANAEQPFAVTIAGSLQSELGCDTDWQPECLATGLSFDADDNVWQQRFSIPAGSYEYKAPIDLSWAENYGANAQLDGANIPLALASDQDVKFYYSHQSHWVTSDQNSLIAVAPGNFQSELGCANDWDPSCLRSWLQDPDGDGVYSLNARLPAGEYEAKVALNENWDVNYGIDGVQNGANIPFSVPLACRLTFFNFDSNTNVLSIGQEVAGPRGDLRKAQAYWIDRSTIAWNSGSSGDQFRLHYSLTGDLRLTADGISGGEHIDLIGRSAGLSAEQRARFPHLSSYQAFELSHSDDALLRQILQGQIALAAVAADGQPVDATGIQIPGVLDDLFPYEADLGPVYAADGQLHLKLWAPTAQSVKLIRYADSQSTTPVATQQMQRDPLTGVWSIPGDLSWDRQYYLYEVSVFVPATQNIEVNRVTDPYSLSLAANSTRSQFVNLDAADLKPTGWDQTRKPVFTSPEDIVLYELHVRDFSILDESIPAQDRGTFNAFTYLDSLGMQHLQSLAEAGVSHLHLLPVFDLATVTERKQDQQNADFDVLSSFPADSIQQQEIIHAVRDQDGFNWGYDPWHYTVPEGSYSSQPDGEQRIRDFRAMVASLNATSLRVVMDVVYNHTTAAGQSERSVLDRIVPGYYHRLNADGDVEMSTCCANTASEHAMMEKLMIDSVLTWAKAYKVDGFRFDLMGHHSKQNMLKLRQALDQLTLVQDGVDGRQIYLYGEGWNFGEVANNARFEQATQGNMSGTGIGTFSDRMRDGARGGNPFSDPRDQGFINGLGYDQSDYQNGRGNGIDELRRTSDWVRIGMAGDIADYQLINANGDLVRADEVDYLGQQAGYTLDPQENIAYVSAHDNETLFDNNQLKLPLNVSMDDRVRVQNLSNALVLLGQGIPFIHAGQEMLRSKSMDRDSFNSGDWYNAIDWQLINNNWGKGLPPAEKNEDRWHLMSPLLADPILAADVVDIQNSVERFKELLRIRSSSKLFRLNTAQQVKDRVRFHNTGPQQQLGLIAMSVNDAEGSVDPFYQSIVIFINANSSPTSIDIPEFQQSNLTLHPVLESANDSRVQEASFDPVQAQFLIPARSAIVFVQTRSALQQVDLLITLIQQLSDKGDIKGSIARAKLVLLRVARHHLAASRYELARVLVRILLRGLDVEQRLGLINTEVADTLNLRLNHILKAVQ